MIKLKKVWLCGMGFMMAGAALAEAKYVAPADVKSRGTKVSEYMFYNQDADKDGKMTLEEFKNQAQTRDVKQHNRALKKKGLYMTPEKQFEVMDTDKDGKITPEELAKFLDEQRSKMN